VWYLRIFEVLNEIMKVILINGSPRPAGCTFTVLSEVASSLNRNDIETEIFQIGREPVSGCLACYSCRNTKKCFIDNDCVNTLAEKMIEADGIVIGSPVYYSGPNGALCSILDRVFFSTAKEQYAYKPVSAVVSCRRSGGTASLDRLHKYFTIANMTIVGSSYWNIVHGNTPEEVRQDLEGMQVMRRLGENMAYLLKNLEVGKDRIVKPQLEKSIGTNFIR